MYYTIDWVMVLDVGVGVGCLFAGIGVLIAFSRLGSLFGRVEKTLDEVDHQVSTISVPVTALLGHVEGIAGTADETIAKLVAVVGSLESVADGVAKTTNLAQHAVAPTLVNLASTLTGVSAGLRKLFGRENGSDNGTGHSPTPERAEA